MEPLIPTTPVTSWMEINETTGRKVFRYGLTGRSILNFAGRYNKFRNYRSLNPPPPPFHDSRVTISAPPPPSFRASTPQTLPLLPLREDAIKRRERIHILSPVSRAVSRENGTRENLLVNKLSVAGHRRLFSRGRGRPGVDLINFM